MTPLGVPDEEVVLAVPELAAPNAGTAATTVAAAMPVGAAKKRTRMGAVAVRWTPQEEQMLSTSVDAVGSKNWAAVAEHMGTGRTASGVEQHWQLMTK